MIRSELTPFVLDMYVTDQHISTLVESGRWAEVAIPLGAGDRHIIVSSVYGISGASSDPAAKIGNARLMAAAFIRKAHFRDVAYVMGADVNENPEDNMVVRALTTAPAPFVFDLMRDWIADEDGFTPPTYHVGQAWQGMQGSWTTRIDTLFGNRCGSQLVTGARYAWDESVGNDHVLLEITMERDP